MRYGNDVYPNHFGLPPEVQQLLRRLAEHAPGAAPAPAHAGGGSERGGRDCDGQGGELWGGDGSENSGERLECGHDRDAAMMMMQDGVPHCHHGQRGADSGPVVTDTAVPPPSTAPQSADGPTGTDTLLLPGGVRVKQEAQDPPPAAAIQPATSATSPPAAESATPPVPGTETQTETQTETETVIAEVKSEPAPASAADGMEVDEDEVSLARAMVRVRNESELNEMAAALLPEPPPFERQETPQDDGQETAQETGQETVQEKGQETAQETGQETAQETGQRQDSETSVSESTGEPSSGPAMAYLGHIDSTSDIYRSLLELAQHNGNQVMLQVAPEVAGAAAAAAGEGAGAGDGLEGPEGPEGEEEPRMSVAEMAAVKMEVGEDSGDGMTERTEGATGEGKGETGEVGKEGEGDGENGNDNGKGGEERREPDKERRKSEQGKKGKEKEGERRQGGRGSVRWKYGWKWRGNKDAKGTESRHRKNIGERRKRNE